MHPLLSRAIGLLLSAALSLAVAAPAPPQARAEVESLLKALRDSGCQFNRNGSWYTGAEAQTHLAKKLEYLEGKNLIKSADDFISLGASTSSSSGKPYLVKCGTTPAVESKTWLQERLATLRQAR
jgi:hypothetical protein